MEMIYDNKKDDKDLSKNAKQYGEIDDKRKIYIEDYAFSFAKDMHIDEDDFGAVGVLLGTRFVRDEVAEIRILGAAEVTNAAVFSDKVAFTSETWPLVKRTTAQFFRGLEIVGWYFVSDQFTENEMDVIAEAHLDSFKDDNDVLLLIDRKAGTEAFYTGSEDTMEEVAGFSVFFDHNDKMQAYLEMYADMHPEFQNIKSNEVEQIDLTAEEKPREKAPKAVKTGGKYREMAREEVKENKVSSNVRTHLSLIYGLSMLLIIVVLVIGVNAINKHDKKNEEAGSSADFTKEAESNLPSVTVESIEGGVTTADVNTEEATTEEPTTEEPTTEEPTTPEPTTPAPTEPVTTASSAEYYTHVIQTGDTIWKLCVQYYGKYVPTDIDLIKNANGWGNNYTLVPGKEMKIPKK